MWSEISAMQKKKSPLLSLYNSQTKEYFYPYAFSYNAGKKQATLKYRNGAVAIITIVRGQKSCPIICFVVTYAVLIITNNSDLFKYLTLFF